ncbi:hypothetical protein [Candidatus Anaplasma sp. TIGMIC]|uniref:hypothetical protein n=1 Tax=Candidatus Anaplasma sp. TIGMIC TaxID=3020713 RepID=UPI00232C86C8|nr:hypothetical protein [Candidatus Anaplasma sp. TIGMIC]MDB1135335.1 hypothetical protein [Candidatus Anaplasma sp. TIGMIC]
MFKHKNTSFLRTLLYPGKLISDGKAGKKQYFEIFATRNTPSEQHSNTPEFSLPSGRFYFSNKVLFYEDAVSRLAIPREFHYLKINCKSPGLEGKNSITASLCSRTGKILDLDSIEEYAATSKQDFIRHATQRAVPISSNKKYLESNPQPLRNVEKSLCILDEKFFDCAHAGMVFELKAPKKPSLGEQGVDVYKMPSHSKSSPKDYVGYLSTAMALFHITDGQIKLEYTTLQKKPSENKPAQSISVDFNDALGGKELPDAIKDTLLEHPVYLIIHGGEYSVSRELEGIYAGQVSPVEIVKNLSMAVKLLRQVNLVLPEEKVGQPFSVLEGYYALPITIESVIAQDHLKKAPEYKVAAILEDYSDLVLDPRTPLRDALIFSDAAIWKRSRFSANKSEADELLLSLVPEVVGPFLQSHISYLLRVTDVGGRTRIANFGFLKYHKDEASYDDGQNRIGLESNSFKNLMLESRRNKKLPVDDAVPENVPVDPPSQQSASATHTEDASAAATLPEPAAPKVGSPQQPLAQSLDQVLTPQDQTESAQRTLQAPQINGGEDIEHNSEPAASESVGHTSAEHASNAEHVLLAPDEAPSDQRALAELTPKHVNTTGSTATRATQPQGTTELHLEVLPGKAAILHNRTNAPSPVDVISYATYIKPGETTATELPIYRYYFKKETGQLICIDASYLAGSVHAQYHFLKVVANISDGVKKYSLTFCNENGDVIPHNALILQYQEGSYVHAMDSRHTTIKGVLPEMIGNVLVRHDNGAVNQETLEKLYSSQGNRPVYKISMQGNDAEVIEYHSNKKVGVLNGESLYFSTYSDEPNTCFMHYNDEQVPVLCKSIKPSTQHLAGENSKTFLVVSEKGLALHQVHEDPAKTLKDKFVVKSEYDRQMLISEIYKLVNGKALSVTDPIWAQLDVTSNKTPKVVLRSADGAAMLSALDIPGGDLLYHDETFSIAYKPKHSHISTLLSSDVEAISSSIGFVSPPLLHNNSGLHNTALTLYGRKIAEHSRLLDDLYESHIENPTTEDLQTSSVASVPESKEQVLDAHNRPLDSVKAGPAQEKAADPKAASQPASLPTVPPAPEKQVPQSALTPAKTSLTPPDVPPAAAESDLKKPPIVPPTPKAQVPKPDSALAPAGTLPARSDAPSETAAPALKESPIAAAKATEKPASPPIVPPTPKAQVPKPDSALAPAGTLPARSDAPSETAAPTLKESPIAAAKATEKPDSSSASAPQEIESKASNSGSMGTNTAQARPDAPAGQALQESTIAASKATKEPGSPSEVSPAPKEQVLQPDSALAPAGTLPARSDVPSETAAPTLKESPIAAAKATEKPASPPIVPPTPKAQVPKPDSALAPAGTLPARSDAPSETAAPTLKESPIAAAKATEKPDSSSASAPQEIESKASNSGSMGTTAAPAQNNAQSAAASSDSRDQSLLPLEVSVKPDRPVTPKQDEAPVTPVSSSSNQDVTSMSEAKGQTDLHIPSQMPTAKPSDKNTVTGAVADQPAPAYILSKSLPLHVGEKICTDPESGKSFFVAHAHITPRYTDAIGSGVDLMMPVPRYVSTSRDVLLLHQQNGYVLHLDPQHLFIKVFQQEDGKYVLTHCREVGYSLLQHEFSDQLRYCTDKDSCSLVEPKNKSYFDFLSEYRPDTLVLKNVYVEGAMPTQDELKGIYNDQNTPPLKAKSANSLMPYALVDLTNPPADLSTTPTHLGTRYVLFEVDPDYKTCRLLQGIGHVTDTELKFDFDKAHTADMAAARKAALEKHPLYIITDGTKIFFSTSLHEAELVDDFKHSESLLKNALLHERVIYSPDKKFYALRVTTTEDFDSVRGVPLQGIGIKTSAGVISIPTFSQEANILFGFNSDQLFGIVHKDARTLADISHKQFPDLRHNVLQEFIEKAATLDIQYDGVSFEAKSVTLSGEGRAITGSLGIIPSILETNSDKVGDNEKKFLQLLDSHEPESLYQPEHGEYVPLAWSTQDVQQHYDASYPITRGDMPYNIFSQLPLYIDDTALKNHAGLSYTYRYPVMLRINDQTIPLPHTGYYFKDGSIVTHDFVNGYNVAIKQNMQFLKVLKDEASGSYSLAFCDQDAHSYPHTTPIDANRILLDIPLQHWDLPRIHSSTKGTASFMLLPSDHAEDDSPVALFPIGNNYLAQSEFASKPVAHLSAESVFVSQGDSSLNLEYNNYADSKRTFYELKLDLYKEKLNSAYGNALHSASNAHPLYVVIQNDQLAFSLDKNGGDNLQFLKDETLIPWLKTVVSFPKDSSKFSLMLTFSDTPGKYKSWIPFSITPVNNSVKLLTQTEEHKNKYLYFDLNDHSISFFDSDTGVPIAIVTSSPWLEKMLHAVVPLLFKLDVSQGQSSEETVYKFTAGAEDPLITVDSGRTVEQHLKVMELLPLPHAAPLSVTSPSTDDIGSAATGNDDSDTSDKTETVTVPEHDTKGANKVDTDTHSDSTTKREDVPVSQGTDTQHIVPTQQGPGNASSDAAHPIDSSAVHKEEPEAAPEDTKNLGSSAAGGQISDIGTKTETITAPTDGINEDNKVDTDTHSNSATKGEGVPVAQDIDAHHVGPALPPQQAAAEGSGNAGDTVPDINPELPQSGAAEEPIDAAGKGRKVFAGTTTSPETYPLWVRATYDDMQIFYMNLNTKYENQELSYHEAMTLYNVIIQESCGGEFRVPGAYVDAAGNVTIGNFSYGDLASFDNMFNI